MRIKKGTNGNNYLLTEDGVYVRDFTTGIVPFDSNSLTQKEEYKVMVTNEIYNNKLNLAELDFRTLNYNDAVIVSDGYQFDTKQHLLAKLPKNVIIIATNRSLAKWKVTRRIDYFVINNPYVESMSALPKHRYFPKCIAASRTYHGFVYEYDKKGGAIYQYCSAPDKNFSSIQEHICAIDDYRNPICAAISLAYNFKVKRLVFLCCDDVFESDRPGTEKLPNDLWMYPQHKISHNIIDAMCFWYLRKPDTKIANHSSGPEYKNIRYISEDELLNFF